jgi:hypothetical protein
MAGLGQAAPLTAASRASSPQWTDLTTNPCMAHQDRIATIGRVLVASLRHSAHLTAVPRA